MSRETTVHTTMPTLSAVLVSWNRRELLERALQSLRDQKYPSLELIVVDNGSTDGSIEALRQTPDVRLVRNTANVGASAARNQGTRLAQGEYVLYMDSDAELRTPGALERLVEYLERSPDTAAASGVYYSDEDLKNLWCWSPCMDWEGNHDAAASLCSKPNPPVLSTCFVLFRHSSLREVGGFDEFFFYLYEDADLCDRLRKKGYRLHVDPEVRVLHHYAEPGRTVRGKINYHYYHEKLRTYFLLKNWGVQRYMSSWWSKASRPLAFRRRFPYLPFVCYVDIYWLRSVLLLLAYPWVRRRRRQKWI